MSSSFLIILGQSLVKSDEDGSLTIPPSLISRVDTGFDFFKKNSNGKILLSGGDTSKTGKSEASVMAALLAERGVDIDKHVWIEETSTNTVENALHTLAYVLEQQQHQQDGEEQEASLVTVVTNDFHVARATFIFESVADKLLINNKKLLRIVGLGAPNCLPRAASVALPSAEGGAPRLSAKAFETELSEHQRLQHERSLLQKGGKLDVVHFARYEVVANEARREFWLQLLSEKILKAAPAADDEQKKE